MPNTNSNKHTGQVAPDIILQKDKASGMPAGSIVFEDSIELRVDAVV